MSFQEFIEENLETMFLEKKLKKINAVEEIFNQYKKYTDDDYSNIVVSSLTETLLYFGEVSKEFKPNGYGVLLLLKKQFLKYFFVVNYVGFWEDGKCQGHGKVYDAKTKLLVFSGYFSGGEREETGKGIEYVPVNGEKRKVFEGLFKRNKRHGRGEFKDIKTEKTVNGVWINGILDTRSIIKEREEEDAEGFPICINIEDIKEELTYENQIGGGSNSTVYKVRGSLLDPLNVDGDEFVAVKIMKFPNSGGILNNILVRTVQRTCYNTRKLNPESKNSRTVKIYAMVQGKNEVGYIEELCERRLDEVIGKNDDSIQKMNNKFWLLLEIAEGMKHIHSKGFMHRDLCLSNIMVSEDFQVKIRDFDSLREDEGLWRMKVMNTRDGIGTPAFLAPEIVSGEYGIKVDVFSYGIIMYCILNEVTNPYDQLEKCEGCGMELRKISSVMFPSHVVDCDLRPPLPLRKKIEDGYLVDLMTSCWEKDPSKRPSFEEITAILKKRKGDGDDEEEEGEVIEVFGVHHHQEEEETEGEEQDDERKKFMEMKKKVKSLELKLEKVMAENSTLKEILKMNGIEYTEEEEKED